MCACERGMKKSINILQSHGVVSNFNNKPYIKALICYCVHIQAVTINYFARTGHVPDQVD